MKILVVAQDFPWPPTYGSRLRLVQVLEVAASLGETDLFSLVNDPGPEGHSVPESLPLKRWGTALRALPNYSPARRARFVASPATPIEVIVAQSKAMRQQFNEWVDSRYDVVWFSKGPTYHLLGRPDLGPTIVDLDDLEDQKIAARLVAMRRDGPKAHIDGSIMYMGAIAQARLNEQKWRTFQHRIAHEVERVVLCSDLDVARFGRENAVVVPNGFEIPEIQAGRNEVGTPPRVLLQGSMRYAPNSDAARWLVKTIAPLIRADRPDVTVRLVGDPDNQVSKLDNPPLVSVAGRVPSMQPELEAADLVAVPLRYGSGTRVKILEAFAHRIPVVSTTIGAEGLNVRSGTHLLIADDPETFAKACVTLLEDTQLRKALTEAAHAEFLAHHHWGIARESIRDVFIETARSKGTDSRSSRIPRRARSIPTDRVGFLVVGSPRSGTTLLQRLSCEIEGVRMPPETHFFSDFVWGLVHRAKFPLPMPDLRKEIERFASLDNSKGLNIDADELVDEFGGECPSVFALFDAIVRQLAGPAVIWGEKTPGHLWWWRAIARAAPWMRFVVTVRDPRAVVASSLAMPWSSSDEFALWGDQLHLAYAARWEFDQRLAASLSDELGPERSLVIRYEDLVSDSDAARLKIARLLGIEGDVTYQVAPSDLVHSWEPWKQHAMDDVTKDRVAAWQSDLGPKRADVVASICRQGMDRFGYTDERPSAARSAVLTAALGKKTRLDLKTLSADLEGYECRLAKLDL